MNVILRNFSTIRKTVDPRQMEYFTELSKIWWDVDGALKLLHSLNKFTLSWIKNRLSEVGAVNPKNQTSIFKGLSFLDVGCGGGILSEPLCRLGSKVVGVDCNPEMIQIARKRAESQNFTNLSYEECTIEEHLRNNFEKYDVIVASEVIEHVLEQEFFLKCCVQCLKPGGSIFLTTNSKTWLSKFFFITLLENILKKLPKGSHEEHLFISFEDVKKLLEKENCQIVDSRGMVYNVFTGEWYTVKNENVFHYAVHAIKSN